MTWMALLTCLQSWSDGFWINALNLYLSSIRESISLVIINKQNISAFVYLDKRRILFKRYRSTLNKICHCLLLHKMKKYTYHLIKNFVITVLFLETMSRDNKKSKIGTNKQTQFARNNNNNEKQKQAKILFGLNYNI